MKLTHISKKYLKNFPAFIVLVSLMSFGLSLGSIYDNTAYAALSKGDCKKKTAMTWDSARKKCVNKPAKTCDDFISKANRAACEKEKEKAFKNRGSTDSNNPDNEAYERQAVATTRGASCAEDKKFWIDGKCRSKAKATEYCKSKGLKLNTSKGGCVDKDADKSTVEASGGANTCGGVSTSIISCDQDGSGKKIENTGLWGILLLVINILTAGVGVLAVAGIVYGSVLYATAGGSADQVKKARNIIVNVVIGVLAFGFMYAILQYIIPGGLFT